MNHQWFFLSAATTFQSKFKNREAVNVIQNYHPIVIMLLWKLLEYVAANITFNKIPWEWWGLATLFACHYVDQVLNDSQENIPKVDYLRKIITAVRRNAFTLLIKQDITIPWKVSVLRMNNRDMYQRIVMIEKHLHRE